MAEPNPLHESVLSTEYHEKTSSAPELDPELESDSKAELSATEVIARMKQDPSLFGCCMMGSDGVVRSFGAHPEYVVFDAVGLGPVQIKQYLDMQPWSQETEDTFRGVDGRKVVDHDALFNPPDHLRPTRFSEEEYERLCQEVVEDNRKLREKIKKERDEGVDVATKYACSRVKADFDLTPKGTM